MKRLAHIFALAFFTLALTSSSWAQNIIAGSTPLRASSAVTAGSSQTAVLSGVAGQYTCLVGAQITLDVPTSGTVPVSGTVTISDGTWTIIAKLVDTTSAGAYYQWPPSSTAPDSVVQSTSTGGNITLTVPAITNGGAGSATIIGYANPGGC